MFIIVVYSPRFALLTVMVADWALTNDANLVYFAKISAVSSSILQVRTAFFFVPQKFCQAIPNFKSDVVLALSRTNFCQASKLSDFTLKWLKMSTKEARQNV